MIDWLIDIFKFAMCWIAHYERWEWVPDLGGNSAYCPECKRESFWSE